MQFSTRNMIGLLSLVVALELAIGTGQLKVTDAMLPAAWIPAIKDWSAALAVVGTAIIGFLSRSIPDVVAAPKPAPLPPVAAAVLLAIGLTFLFGGGDAFAQIKRPQVTGNIIADIKANNAGGVTPAQGIDAVWAKMKDASLVDLQYAKSLADAVNSPRSKIRSTCYGAWITVVQQSQGLTAGTNGAPLGPMPDPSMFSHFEQAVQVVDNLQPDSPFMVACQPAANLLKQSILQFVSTAVGGVTSLGALGLGIP